MCGSIGHILRHRRTDAATGGLAEEWFHDDQVGSVVAVSGDTGAKERLRYADAFGNAINPMTGLWKGESGWGHNSKARDAGTGLTYMYQRWYDPQLGVFASKAPYPPYMEPEYSFALQRPPSLLDPEGNEPFTCALAGGGALAAGGGGAAAAGAGTAAATTAAAAAGPAIGALGIGIFVGTAIDQWTGASIAIGDAIVPFTDIWYKKKRNKRPPDTFSKPHGPKKQSTGKEKDDHSAPRSGRPQKKDNNPNFKRRNPKKNYGGGAGGGATPTEYSPPIAGAVDECG